MHQVLLIRGQNVFAEVCWKPFTPEFCHRMYSETKSYVSIAIGLLVEDGKLKLTDKICDLFSEKIDSQPGRFIPDLTVEDMLKMSTCGLGGVPFWFYDGDVDRTHMYLNKCDGKVPSGMRWEYDSAGSQVLSSLVEKLSGKSLFDFLNERIFTHLDAFKTAQILKTKNGDSWGDSALVCTPRDMAAFARFVMNYGTFNGKRLMNEEYLKKATSRLVDNNISIQGGGGYDASFAHGYGYQIWRVKDGFAFNGMGSQFTVCLPEKDLIFVCTADTQGFTAASELIMTALYDFVVDELSDTPLDADNDAYESLLAYAHTLELYSMTGDKYSPYQDELCGKTWQCEENPLGWKEFSFDFSGDTPVLRWVNEQGEKKLPFGLCKNVFGKFPQLGYQNIYGGVKTTDGFMYDGAYSAAWREEKKIILKVQIIDKYFGNLTAEFSFKDDIAFVRVRKIAEGFLEEYHGDIIAHLI